MSLPSESKHGINQPSLKAQHVSLFDCMLFHLVIHVQVKKKKTQNNNKESFHLSSKHSSAGGLVWNEEYRWVWGRFCAGICLSPGVWTRSASVRAQPFLHFIPPCWARAWNDGEKKQIQMYINTNKICWVKLHSACSFFFLRHSVCTAARATAYFHRKWIPRILSQTIFLASPPIGSGGRGEGWGIPECFWEMKSAVAWLATSPDVFSQTTLETHETYWNVRLYYVTFYLMLNGFIMGLVPLLLDSDDF